MKAIQGFSVVELMVSVTIGLLLVTGMLGVYLTQMQTYRTTISQAALQNADNAIAALLIPVIRSAGFAGCATNIQVLSNLNAGGSPPLGTLQTTPAMIAGYQATTALTQQNAANDSNASHWSPTLDASLTGNVESGSDVLVVLGAAPGSQPVTVTTIANGSNSLVVQNGSGLVSGQFAAVSDCLKASIFRMTGVSGTTVTHTAGSGVLTNATAAFAVNYAPGAQLVALQQTAFFVGFDQSGQSALMQGILNGSTWTIQALVPGVDTMEVLYGTGANGIPTQYVPASAVTNWGNVYSVRIGLLVAGRESSGSTKNTNPTQFTVLGNLITVPADNRLRHVFEMTIKLRNAIL